MIPYDLTKLGELVAFDDDCNNAACECPQFDTCSNELQILRRAFSAKEVYYRWKKEEVLWRYGYWECLTDRAKDTFAFVREFGERVLRGNDV